MSDHEGRKRPSQEEQKQALHSYIQGVIDCGIRLTPLTEGELREMTADQLYAQLADHEQISSEFSTAGGVIVQQMEHRALVRKIYIEKVLPVINRPGWFGVWDSDSLSELTISEIDRKHKRAIEVNAMHNPMEF